MKLASQSARPAPQRAGFALLELLVALAIFAVIAAVAYRGIASVTQARETIGAHALRLKEVQLAVAMMERDLRQAAARPIRGAYGEVLPALVGARGQVELSCYGFGSAYNEARSLLDRVGYAYGDGKLARLAYPVLDRAPQTQVARRPVLDSVEAMRLRYLDPTGRWLESWPPVDRTADPQALPRAVELVLRLEDYGEIRRVIELADAQPALAATSP